MLHRDAVYCSVLQCVAVEHSTSISQILTNSAHVIQHTCCSMLHHTCCSVLRRHTLSDLAAIHTQTQVCCSVLQCVAALAEFNSLHKYVAVCCSVLQCVAVCCSVLQLLRQSTLSTSVFQVLQCVAVCCSALTVFQVSRHSTLKHKRVAVCCSVL